MGSRFIAALLGSFIVTLVLLAGAGYAITQFTVGTPRDPFRTPAFEFDMAAGWWCEREGTEYVCQPPGKAPLPAIAVIAIKERNNQDNLEAYEAHLKQPQNNPVAGNDKISQVRYAERRTLGGREWVAALHLGSEIKNYETYYLGTATSHLGILITMSVHKDHEKEYIDQLNEMMETLNVYQR